MSDGASNNSFGDALESISTNTKKAIGGTLADFTKSATNQVKGNSGISGSFTPGQGNPSAGGPNTLSGGDLFSPDMLAGKPKPQAQQGTTLLQSAQQGDQDSGTKSPEELAKIQHIEQELKSMHQQYYQDFLQKAEGRDRKTVVEQQQKAQDDQAQHMDDMQKADKRKQESQEVFRAKRASEIKGGMG